MTLSTSALSQRAAYNSCPATPQTTIAPKWLTARSTVKAAPLRVCVCDSRALHICWPFCLGRGITLINSLMARIVVVK